jgi:hypothetical protein
MKFLRLSTLSLTIVLFTLGGLISPENTTLAEHCKGKHKDDMGCDGGGGGDSGGGGKAFLFISPEFTCADGATNTGDPSFGQVTWAGNVLWDPEFIHVHFKLQLKDVEPTGIVRYEILGNNDIACTAVPTPNIDFRLCEDGVCDGTFITVKQNRQGRTSGAVRLPGDMPGETTRVWVRVDVTVGGEVVELRSTAVTVVLPPNAAGTGTD